MKKLFTTILYLFFLGFSLETQAQVLFTEDFNSYPTGPLTTVYNGTTPGHGGWLVERSTGNVTAMVTAEAGKGNVLTIKTMAPSSGSDHVYIRQVKNVITAAWNSRTVGNDILKLEYEFNGNGDFFSGCSIASQNRSLISSVFQSNLNNIAAEYWDNNTVNIITLKNFTSSSFPYNIWVKVEMYVDYNTKKIYFYLPNINIMIKKSFAHNNMPEILGLSASTFNSAFIVKFDNIKLSALYALPSYILSTNEQLAAKFNMYPNPTTNVVNITNSENMLVQQVTIYDISGKQLSIQTFNNENEIQLNVENLASGTYMLHLQTNEGLAVKKMVKK